jgi:hypothetical protein
MKFVSDDWDSAEEMLSAFQEPMSVLDGVELVVAQYDTPPYSGEAVVFYVTENGIYHVSGSHCSCFDLEGQWGPEETTVEVIEKYSETSYRSTLRECSRMFLKELAIL